MGRALGYQLGGAQIGGSPQAHGDIPESQAYHRALYYVAGGVANELLGGNEWGRFSDEDVAVTERCAARVGKSLEDIKDDARERLQKPEVMAALRSGAHRLRNYGWVSSSEATAICRQAGMKV